jgi:hypothetical protein
MDAAHRERLVRVGLLYSLPLTLITQRSNNCLNTKQMDVDNAFELTCDQVNERKMHMKDFVVHGNDRTKNHIFEQAISPCRSCKNFRSCMASLMEAKQVSEFRIFLMYSSPHPRLNTVKCAASAERRSDCKT